MDFLLAALFSVMSVTNIRAPLREVLSMTDASEKGGVAAEARSFAKPFGGKAESREMNLIMNSCEGLLIISHLSAANVEQMVV